MTQKVFRTPGVTRTITLLEWGSGARVKDVVTDNDAYKTRLVSANDEYYESPEEARRVYDELVVEYPGA